MAVLDIVRNKTEDHIFRSVLLRNLEEENPHFLRAAHEEVPKSLEVLQTISLDESDSEMVRGAAIGAAQTILEYMFMESIYDDRKILKGQSASDRLPEAEEFVKGQVSVDEVTQQRLDLVEELADAFYDDMRSLYQDSSVESVRKKARWAIYWTHKSVPFSKCNEAGDFLKKTEPERPIPKEHGTPAPDEFKVEDVFGDPTAEYEKLYNRQNR